jgi:UPF0271 protein
MNIDLNCDLGESFGAFTIGEDAAILPLISSASIACGLHGGDPATMRRTVALCLRHGVAIGAHPGLPDLAGFGRREMALSTDEVYELCLYQIGALAAFCQAAGAPLHHVKPHGALYNMAARDAALATAVAQAVRDFRPDLMLYGLAGSELVRAGRAHGLPVAEEAFADRRYESDGRLTPRREAGAVLEAPEEAAAQAADLVIAGRVRSRQGTLVAVRADTICLHGDRPRAAAFARCVRQRLDQHGIAVRPPVLSAGPGGSRGE